MNVREPVKVYELAKELGLDSISLLDRLKGLEINVKNHMSELTDIDVERARVLLKSSPVTSSEPKKTKTSAKTGTKAGTTKKAASTTSAATQAGAAKTTANATAAAPVKKRTSAAASTTNGTSPSTKAATGTTKTASKTKATETAGTTVPQTAAQIAAAKEAANATSTSTVIRRRVLADGATQTVTSTTVSTLEEQQAAAQAAKQNEPALEEKAAIEVAAPTPFVEEAEETMLAVQELVSGPIETEELQAPAPTETSALVTPEAITPAPLPVTPVDAASLGVVETVRTEVKTEGGKTRTSIIRRVETTSTSVGKSLLRVVEQPKAVPTRPQVRSPGSPMTPNPMRTPGVIGADNPVRVGADRFKLVRVDKENLDRMAEEEAKKRGPRAFESVVKPEDVKFADYRKKEMIFIPKRKKPPVGRDIKKTEITVAAAHKRVVEMGDSIPVADLAHQMQLKTNDVIKKLMQMGQMVTMHQSIDFDTASLVAQEFSFEVKNIAFKEDQVIEAEVDTAEDLVARPPIVTIMGHVDHGKTTLLDAIREANVASGEAGGITQHIGAYTVTKEGKLITFIDTPGHEAFTMMRARGANVTDIVILVVAADDGVMPQTREAISHAKAAGVPIIVAVNKMDKPGANPDRVRQALAELELLAEDWGGQTIFVPVSALKKEGLDKLLESILLVAEMQDLKSNPKSLARGVILEARLEKGRGPVASLLVQRGTLHVGDIVVAGLVQGKVKAMTDHLGTPVKSVAPGMAAEILGFATVPNAGERFDAVSDEDEAETLTTHRSEVYKQANQRTSKASLEDLFAKVKAGDTKELRIVLKGDVFGSVEAVRDSLVKLSTDRVKIKVLLASPGGISESDVMLANASNAIIVGFNVRPETKARALAEQESIEVKCYNIIYELIDDVKKSMAGLLDKKKVERYLGRAEVRQTFSVPKLGTVAGGSVIDGVLQRNANIRLLRDSRVIFDGKLASLKRFKDDAKEVAQGYECGMGIEGYNDVKIGDIIEAYQIDMVTQEL